MNKTSGKAIAILALAAALCITAGCNLGGEKARTEKLVEKTLEYWPLDKGNEWEYEITGQPGQSEKQIWIMKVSEVKDSSIGKIATVDSTYKSRSGFKSQMEMAVTPGGIYEVRHSTYISGAPQATGTQQMVTETPALGVEPPYQYKSNPKVGDEWAFEFGPLIRNGSQLSGRIFKGKGKVEAVEDVAAPAGKINATKISFTTYSENGAVNERRLLWLAEGIGPVRISSRNVNFNLIKATVNGKIVVGK